MPEILDKPRGRLRRRRLSSWPVFDCVGYSVSVPKSLFFIVLNRFREGRGAAAEVDAYLSEGSTRLPSAGGIKTRVRSACSSLGLRRDEGPAMHWIYFSMQQARDGE